MPGATANYTADAGLHGRRNKIYILGLCKIVYFYPARSYGEPISPKTSLGNTLFKPLISRVYREVDYRNALTMELQAGVL